MTPDFRQARRDDVAAVVDLLREDVLGETREGRDIGPYLAAFDAMAAEGRNLTVVGEAEGRIIATYQITFISGLSISAARRAQVEGVRVATDMRGRGVGRAMFADAEARARAAGCRLIQLTMNAARDSGPFYESLGFVASHIGFKRLL